MTASLIAPDYLFAQGRLVSTATGASIPEDEPFCVLTGRDRGALWVLEAYRGLSTAPHFQAILDEHIAAFRCFAEAFPNRMLPFPFQWNVGHWPPSPADGCLSAAADEPYCVLRASDPYAGVALAIALEQLRANREFPACRAEPLLAFAVRHPERMASVGGGPFQGAGHPPSAYRGAQIADLWASEVIMSECGRQDDGVYDLSMGGQSPLRLDEADDDVRMAAEWLRDRGLARLIDGAAGLRIELLLDT